jgi:hypothetical protein
MIVLREEEKKYYHKNSFISTKVKLVVQTFHIVMLEKLFSGSKSHLESRRNLFPTLHESKVAHEMIYMSNNLFFYLLFSLVL